MTRRDAFSHYHPLVNFLYFALVIGAGMALRHPAAQCITLAAAACYCCSLEGKGALWRTARPLLPLLIFAAVINLFVSHEGQTVLLRLPSGTALTLESFLYGLSSAVMLLTVILSFRAFTVVITTDKFLFLFGRIIPSLSLVLTMTLRFVPLFTRRLQQVRAAQQTLHGQEGTTFMARLRRGIAILGTLITWSLEKAIDTGDTMKSRGYGLPGRTAYSRYRLARRDILAMSFLLFCAASLIAGCCCGVLPWQYYPYLAGPMTLWSVLLLILYAGGCFLPLILQGKEVRQWHSLTFED